MNLPDWMRFYFDLGSYLAEQLDKPQILTIVVSLPTRAYAAVATAASLVSCRALNPSPNYTAELLLTFNTLEKDTSLIYWRNGLRKKVRYQGICSITNRKMISFQTEKGEIRYIDLMDIQRLRIVRNKDFRLPMKQKGHLDENVQALIKWLIPNDKQMDFIDKTNCICGIIGRVLQLQAETSAQLLCCGERETGSFGDILRVRNFQTQYRSYKSIILPSSAQKLSLMGEQKPEVIILDGARSFLRWRRDLRNFNKIIFLDRTDRSYLEGVGEINQYSATAKVETVKKIEIQIPNGIEMMIMKEARER